MSNPGKQVAQNKDEKNPYGLTNRRNPEERYPVPASANARRYDLGVSRNRPKGDRYEQATASGSGGKGKSAAEKAVQSNKSTDARFFGDMIEAGVPELAAEYKVQAQEKKPKKVAASKSGFGGTKLERIEESEKRVKK